MGRPVTRHASPSAYTLLLPQEAAPPLHSLFLRPFFPQEPLRVGNSPKGSLSIDWAGTHEVAQHKNLS